MKSIIVFYSLEGNSRLVAQKLSKLLNAEILELKPKKAYPTGSFSKFLWGGKSAVMSETPELESYSTNLDEFDTVILGTPVWAGTLTPPLRTFLKNNSLEGKKIAAYACAAGKRTEKALSAMQELAGQTLVATQSFIDPAAGKDSDFESKLNSFADKIKGPAE